MEMDMVVVLGPETVASPWNSDDIHTFFEKPYKKKQMIETTNERTTDRPNDQTN